MFHKIKSYIRSALIKTPETEVQETRLPLLVQEFYSLYSKTAEYFREIFHRTQTIVLRSVQNDFPAYEGRAPSTNNL